MNDPKQKKRAPVPPDRAKPQVNCAFDEEVLIEKLVPNPRNPNQHPESQVRLLAKAITHQGWRSPIVVSTRSGFIVAGHGRFEAAKVLGLVQVPVDYQDFASEADEWAYLVADNRLAELAEADEAALKAILGELKAGDFDLDVAWFDAAALDSLLAGTDPALTIVPSDPRPNACLESPGSPRFDRLLGIGRFAFSARRTYDCDTASTRPRNGLRTGAPCATWAFAGLT